SFKRTYRSNSPSDRIRMSVSKKFEEAIDVALKMALDAKARIASNKKSNSDAFDVRISLHSAIRDCLFKLFEDSFSPGQLFIPAGRSFFTSIGKAITAFDNQNMLDPLVLRFGRLVTQIRDPSQ